MDHINGELLSQSFDLVCKGFCKQDESLNLTVQIGISVCVFDGVTQLFTLQGSSL